MNVDKGREHKPHIGIFGRRNAGKSSLINALTGQYVAIVSDVPGTTTDPVKKSIEIPGVGPAILIDTAGIDDAGVIGTQRVHKTKEIFKIIDLALVVMNDNEWGKYEEALADDLYEEGVPFILVHSKADQTELDGNFKTNLETRYKAPVLSFSSMNGNSEDLMEMIRITMPETSYRKQSLLGDLVASGDIVLLITPVDTEAPEGRLILPQVQAIRDILDNDCIAVVVKEREADAFLNRTQIKPKLAICDTSVILKADSTVPRDIPLTGFSILLARYKGEFNQYLAGTPVIDQLKNEDRILLLESCTHHVSCDDIGRMKIPRWMNKYTGKNLYYDIVSGLNRIERPITDYALIIQCGGCMITRKQIINRLRPAIQAGVPVTNYGMAIAWMQGVYARAIEPFIQTNEPL